MKAHPGFKAVQSSIAKKEGISKERAGAILASQTRKASPAAKAANPHLKHVKGNTRGHSLHTPDRDEFRANTSRINKAGHSGKTR